MEALTSAAIDQIHYGHHPRQSRMRSTTESPDTPRRLKYGLVGALEYDDYMDDHGRRYFVCIGAQKAGTTWLHTQLSLHQEIALPSRKETHYFDMVTNDRTPSNHGLGLLREVREAIAAGNRAKTELLLDILSLSFKPPGGYLDYLARTANAHTQIIGDITPAYACLSHDGFSYMKRIMKPKVIFIMRDPLERYWSAVRMVTRKVESFEEAFNTLHRDMNHWVRSDYASTIQLLDECFPAEDTLYLFYEELMRESSLRRVAEFLDVNADWPHQVERRVHVGRAHMMPPVTAEVVDKFQPIYDFVSSRFGHDVPAQWVQDRATIERFQYRVSPH